MDILPYEFEIRHIINELKDIERGIFYEVDHVRGTASAKTIAKNVREMFEDMIIRMAEGQPGRMESIFRRDTEDNKEFKEAIEKLKKIADET